MRKTILWFLSVCLLVSMACPPVYAESATYSATQQGFAGDVTVWVTVENDAVTDVTAQGLHETPGKGSIAIDELPEKIVAAGGTAGVDVIAGATVTSNAIIRAVNEAIAGKVEGSTPSNVSIAYTPGTYEGKGFGFCSYITVSVTFSEDAITDIQIVDNSGETVYLRDLCAEAIPAEILKNQSLNVDTVSGATSGSNGIIKAVSDCVMQAADENVVAALKAVPIAKPSPVDECYEGYDLCVVGGGGSGITAATVAHDKGLKVIVIEASDRFGGVSEIAGGGTMAIGTKLQLQAEQPDGSFVDLYKADGTTVEAVFNDVLQRYLDATHYEVNALLVKRYLEAAGIAPDYLNELGMPFLKERKRTDGVRLGEKGMRFRVLAEKLGDDGVTLLCNTRGEHILMQDGKVAGVTAVNSTGGTTTIYAKSVLLATGGFSNNTEMMREYISDYKEEFMNWGSSTANGDGVKMAWEVGAAKGTFGVQSHNEGLPLELHDLLDLDVTLGNCLYAGLAYEPMLRLNRNTGRRISDETIMKMPDDHGNTNMISGGMLVVVDQATIDSLMANGSKTPPWRGQLASSPMNVPDYTGYNLQQQVDMVVDAGFAWKADSIEELAEKVGLDPSIMANEVAKYNTAVKTGFDEEFGRDPATLVYTIEEGPFYVLNTKVRILGGYGGITTDETLGVYDTEGALIPGLYACGLDAMGWMGESYFVNTTTLGWVVSSGYMAGSSIAEYVNK